ncbi:hypothetical protein PS15m_001730 [Mucor circinelloides]
MMRRSVVVVDVIGEHEQQWIIVEDDEASLGAWKSPNSPGNNREDTLIKTSNKLSSCSTSAGQARLKKIRINGLSQDYSFLKWIEASLQILAPGLEYFSFAEQFEGTEEATNTNYKDLLLTLQSRQINFELVDNH